MSILMIKNIDKINDKFREIILNELDTSTIIPEVDINECYSKRWKEEEKKEIFYRIREINELIQECFKKNIISFKDLMNGYISLKSTYDDDLFRLLHFLKNKLENNKE